MTNNDYIDFLNRLKVLIGKRPDLITITLSNIFTMRLIGNKTHGDLAEIAISEFVNQYMYDFKSRHVGKDLYRAKSKEEDIEITNEINQKSFPVSLKAYGDGPLQLSTDKNLSMYALLESFNEEHISGDDIGLIFSNSVFTDFQSINVLPLIYNEKKKKCNIMVFDMSVAKSKVLNIKRISEGSGRKHPVYIFSDKDDNYICEVRYGGATANALQRGLWTNTKRASKYFNSITNGWIDYSHNLILVELFSHALVASAKSHTSSLNIIKDEINALAKGKQV